MHPIVKPRNAAESEEVFRKLVATGSLFLEIDSSGGIDSSQKMIPPV